MHSCGAAVNSLMSVMEAGVLSSQAAHHFKGTSNDSTQDIAKLERTAVLWQLNEVYQRIILKHLISSARQVVNAHVMMSRAKHVAAAPTKLQAVLSAFQLDTLALALRNMRNPICSKRKLLHALLDNEKQLLCGLAFVFTRAILSAVSLKSTHFVVLDLARNSSISRIPML